MNTLVCIGGIVIIFILLFAWLCKGGKESCSEGFIDKKDKATTILQWFTEQEKPCYNNYRSIIEGDVVEYSDVCKLRANGNFTVDNIIKVI